MNIPTSFKKVQASVFQDKTVEHYLPVSVKGSLSSITTKPSDTVLGKYRVNFQIVTNALKAEEWGLKINRDATMTSSAQLPVKETDYIRYNGVFYRVVGVQPFDAYTLYLLKAV